MTQERYISSRATAVRSIESTIAELQGIFRQLSMLVAEQGELIERIDHNTEQAAHNISGAQSALMKYWQNISSNRTLMLKIFFVLLVFVVIFLVFFV